MLNAGNCTTEVSPSDEIVFKGPFLNSVVSSKLTIRNLTDKTVAFKIKTTAPRRYCVRPNSGTLMPTESLEIYVMLQPCNESLDGVNDKFMVQSMIIPDDQSNTQDVWKSASKEEIFETKLKCTFLNVAVQNRVNSDAVTTGPSGLLEVSPRNEIVFKGPFSETGNRSTIFSKLTIRNLTEKTVAFNMKTTAPSLYCVRPNRGFLVPAESLQIDVVLRPCKENLNRAAHKFMVQSMIVPDGRSYNGDVWKTTSLKEVFEIKLNCAFENVVDTKAQWAPTIFALAVLVFLVKVALFRSDL